MNEAEVEAALRQGQALIMRRAETARALTFTAKRAGVSVSLNGVGDILRVDVDGDEEMGRRVHAAWLAACNEARAAMERVMRDG